MNYSAGIINTVPDYLIDVVETRISRRFSIPDQINFRLDINLLTQIEYLQQNNYQLNLSATKLANLRYYALINSPLKKSLNITNTLERASLSFTTNYLCSNSQQSTSVIRSVINLEGNISQQVQHDLWQNNQLFSRVINVHHWLILQVINQLPLKTPNYFYWLFNTLSTIILLAIGICLWFFLSLKTFYKIPIFFSLFYIFIYQKLGYSLIKKQLKNWLLNSVTNGFMSNTAKKRQLTLNLLKLFV